MKVSLLIYSFFPLKNKHSSSKCNQKHPSQFPLLSRNLTTLGESSLPTEPVSQLLKLYLGCKERTLPDCPSHLFPLCHTKVLDTLRFPKQATLGPSTESLHMLQYPSGVFCSPSPSANFPLHLSQSAPVPSPPRRL